MAQPSVVRHEQVGTLPSPSSGPADDPTHGLTEEELGRGRCCIHAHPQPRDVDPFGHHADGNDPGRVPRRETTDLRRRIRVLAHGDGRIDPVPMAKMVGDTPGMRLVHCDDEATRLGMFLPDLDQLGVGMPEHGRQPLTLQAQRRPQTLVGLRPNQGIVETGREMSAVWGHPLHRPAEAGEEHRTDDAAVAERIAVAVLDVRHDLVVVVPHEGNRTSVTAEGRTGQGEAPGRPLERQRYAVAPRSLLAGVMDLVEDHESALDQRRKRLRRRPDLLIGGHDSVDV